MYIYKNDPSKEQPRKTDQINRLLKEKSKDVNNYEYKTDNDRQKLIRF